MTIQFHALPKETVAQIRQTGRDSYDNPVEHHTSDGSVYPCRHCLGTIPKDQPYLILAHRPFQSDNPYAETGPIFLCADCEQAQATGELPAVLKSPTYILRGYTADERILYGTGGVVPTHEIPDRAAILFENPDIAFADVRSAANNCFQCRIKRA